MGEDRHKHPLLGIRGVPRELAGQARAKAKAEGTDLSAVIGAYLRRYVAAKPRRKA